MRGLCIAGLLLVPAFFAACSSGESRLSKSEYDERVAEIVRGPGQTADRLFFAVVTDRPPGDCTTQARRFHETLDEIVAEVDALRPPEEIERLHEEFVDAASESVALVGEAVEDVAAGDLRCGQALNERIYGLPSTDRAVAVIGRLRERGYVPFLLGE